MDPKFKRPDLLIHPNLPKPLHGLSPRTIFGSGWWNKVRKSVYEVNNYCCFVDGLHKSLCSPKHLEAHEAYDIDYQNGVVRLKEIVALCKQCHTFIHSGRLLGLVDEGRVSEQYADGIMLRGMRILQENNLVPTYDAFVNSLIIQGLNPPQIDRHLKKHPEIVENPDVVPWNEWRLILGDKEYRSLYANEEEWRQRYRSDE